MSANATARFSTRRPRQQARHVQCVKCAPHGTRSSRRPTPGDGAHAAPAEARSAALRCGPTVQRLPFTPVPATPTRQARSTFVRVAHFHTNPEWGSPPRALRAPRTDQRRFYGADVWWPCAIESTRFTGVIVKQKKLFLELSGLRPRPVAGSGTRTRRMEAPNLPTAVRTDAVGSNGCKNGVELPAVIRLRSPLSDFDRNRMGYANGCRQTADWHLCGCRSHDPRPAASSRPRAA
jgi:hypothetical protein